MGQLVLLVGPARRTSALRRSCFAEPPFEIVVTSSPVQALAIAREKTPSAVVVFIERDGAAAVQVCRELRAAGSFPLIVAAERHKPELVIELLEAGADDFVTHSITPRELRARVRAHVRRAVQYAQVKQPLIRLGPLEIDRDRHLVRLGEETISLSPKEFALLEFLAANPDRVVRREELLEKIWDLPQTIKSRTLDVHMSRLRQKLSSINAPITISTIPGIGYRLTVP